MLKVAHADAGVSGDYRADVDGLRAIAVLVPGFLIAGVICRELDRGRFSFRDAGHVPA